MGVEVKNKSFKEELNHSILRLSERYQISGDYWQRMDSSVADYDQSFRPVLGDKTIRGFVKDIENPVVVDLMASTAAIADLFFDHQSSGKLGIAVSLHYNRKTQKITRDQKLNIVHVEGDLSGPVTWRVLEKQLNGRKADLIIERGLAAFDYVPNHPAFFAAIVNRLWRMLSSDGGIILAELYPTPVTSRSWDILEEIAKWIYYIKEQGIDADSAKGIWCGGSPKTSSVILLRRNANSPQELPIHT